MNRDFARPAKLVLDTSGIVALYDASASEHAEAVVCVQAAALRLIPAAILAEIDYMLGVRLAPAAASDFLRGVESGFFVIEQFTRDDAHYCSALNAKYARLQLGLADAAVMAVAERHRVPDVLSLDRRHFGVVVPSVFDAFRLWPDVSGKSPAAPAAKRKRRS